jgi:hypothetical protein
MIMPRSRKLFALEFVESTWKKRVLVSGAGEKYNPERHFLPLEESDYLEEALKGVPYGTFRTDVPEEMTNLLQNGYKDENNTIWTSFFAYWKDQEGHAFLCPESAGIKDLRDVGVLTYMERPADFMKVGKYSNRLFSPCQKNVPMIATDTGKVEFTGGSTWGKEVSWNPADQTSIVLLEKDGEYTEEERSLAIRYVDLDTLDAERKALVDGALVISEKAARMLNLSNEPRLSMAWRGTFGTERGLGKGHILYKNDMSVDVVIYGPKTILKTDKFFFGSMGQLHVGNPHTDMQAYVNFHYHRAGLAVDLAKAFMREVMVASSNEAELRKLFLRHTADLKHADLDQEGWVLRRALAYGVSFLRFPGLYRRVIRYLMKRVMACDTRARIPMSSSSYSVAGYGYVLPDPNVISPEGDVILENAIPEGHIVFPDVKPGTKVVCYRQPSENTNAWVPLTVMYRPEYKHFAGQGVCLLGRGAHKVLGRLGGGDMDDQFVIVHDPKWVESFHTMRTYPETEKISAETTEDEEAQYDERQRELSEFTESLTEDLRDPDRSHYTNRHVDWQIELAKNSRAGIGPVVNYGMIDLLLSDPDHKASMLADLTNLHDERASDAAEWLDYREPYQAAKFMTNLEIVIDGNVKDRTLLDKLGDVSGTIKQFHTSCKVYPTCMTGRRIPQTKQKKDDYVLARSLTCRSLDMIKMLRDRLEEIFVQREWDLVAPADTDLRDQYPFSADLNARVRGRYKMINTPEGRKWERIDADQSSLMDIWAREWREALSIPNNPEVVAGITNKRIVSLIAQEVEGEDDETMESLAVEIYFQTYRRYGTEPKVDEVTGKLRNYQDGLLWCPVFCNHFINALRKARLSGFYSAAELRHEFIGRLKDASTMVQVRGHSVYIQDSNNEYTVHVGIVSGKAPDGEYRMDGGLIEFRRGKEIVQPQEHLRLAQKPLTRIIKPKNDRLIDSKTPEAKGSFGKLLSKALTILGIEEKK